MTLRKRESSVILTEEKPDAVPLPGWGVGWGGSFLPLPKPSLRSTMRPDKSPTVRTLIPNTAANRRTHNMMVYPRTKTRVDPVIVTICQNVIVAQRFSLGKLIMGGTNIPVCAFLPAQTGMSVPPIIRNKLRRARDILLTWP